MSGTDQLISISIDAEDPKYYADLLCKIPGSAKRRLCSDVPGFQNVDVVLSQRLQMLLDAVSNISLRRRGNVSATMASFKDNNRHSRNATAHLFSTTKMMNRLFFVLDTYDAF